MLLLIVLKKRNLIQRLRQHDIIGAHANHIPCIGVLYGYGNREEFENYQCDYIVQDLNELKGVIENV